MYKYKILLKTTSYSRFARERGREGGGERQRVDQERYPYLDREREFIESSLSIAKQKYQGVAQVPGSCTDF
jgi:hypothetical protein